MKDDGASAARRTPSVRRPDPLDVTGSPTAVSLREPPASAAPPSRPSSLRRWGLIAAAAGLFGVFIVNVVLISASISSADPEKGPAAASPGASATPPSGPASAPTALASAAADQEDDEPTAGAEPPASADPDPEPAPSAEPAASADPNARKPKDNPRIRTVQQAAAKSCSTSSVDGLSRQIVRQSRCIDPNAFVAVPAQPNLETDAHVFLYMERSARDQLVRVLAAHRDQTMTVHSALRTVAQQYLLRSWATSKRCGIQLATLPGESNHETGLALDISQPQKWRAALEASGFTWLGAKDRVHFDYRGRGASSRTGVDVMAFQQLWNRNHPEDPISATGRYNAATEVRLKSAPSAGFPVGAGCGQAPSREKSPGPDE